MRPKIVVAAAIAVVALGASHASADPVKCSRTIAKEYGKYVAAEAKIIDKCKNGVITKGTPASLGSCPDPAGSAKITDAATKMRAKIAAACGGPDKHCDAAGDDSLASIHWNIPQCMGFEGQCNNPIATCDDVGICLACIGDAALEQGIDGLLYDRFNSAAFFPANAADPAKSNNVCQVTIAKAGVQFVQTKLKILNKCWDAKLNNKTGFADGTACPDTDPGVGSGNPPASPGDNKSVEAIKKAEQKKVAAICKACAAGGDSNKDEVCDDPSTLTLSNVITTPFTCPSVTVPPNAVHPSGLACGSITVNSLPSYIQCIDCVLEFKADCVTHAGVGDNAAAAGIDYPSQCNPGGPTPTPTATPAPVCTPRPNCGNGVLDAGEQCDPNVANSCPGNAQCAPANLCGDACTCPSGSFSLSATAGADLDTGWTGIAHDQAALVGHVFDALTYGCSSAGADKSCGFVSTYALPFFGPPLPLSSGGVPVCVVNEIVGTPTGSLDLVTGELHYNYDLSSQVFNGIANDHPCPTCDGDIGIDDGMFQGTCNGGPSNGNPCDADATSPIPAFGHTSFNCFPDPAAQVGTLPISFKDANTGTKTIAITAASPFCTANGFTGQHCFCDTCDDAAATPCSSNADCAPGGMCGGLRCLSDATTPGTPCSTEGTGSDAVCGSGTCGLGTCNGTTCTAGPLVGSPCAMNDECNACATGPHIGTGCFNDQECGGTCAHPGEATKPNACSDGVCVLGGAGQDDARCQAGPNDSLCSVERFRGCTTNADCRPAAEGGTCPGCAPGMQSCGLKRRECFTSTVAKTGTPGIPNGAYVGNFCIAPTGSSAVNGVAGLPGLGALRLPYSLAINVP